MITSKKSILNVNAHVMRAINRSSILELIRCKGPLSRSHIVEELHVSLPTVSRIVDDLATNGWIQEVGEKETSGGRKRAMIKFRGSDHFIIGIDLGGTKIYGAVVDFNGKIHHEMYFDHHQTQADESVQVVFHVIDRLLSTASLAGLKLCGIGIGVPGITIPETGIVCLAPALGWR